MPVTHRLLRRERIYYYRRRVPLDLRGVVRTKEIVRSLGTTKLATARKRATILDAEVYRLFDELRERRGRVEEERLVERLCGAYLRQLITEDRQHRRRYSGKPDAEWGGLSDALERESELLDRRRFDHVRADAEALLTQEGIELEGEALDGLLWELARTRLQAFSQMMDERTGDSVGKPRESVTRATTGATMGETEAKPSRPLSEVIALYIEDHEGKTWKPRTASMIKSELRRFLEIVGDKPIREVTKDEIRHYRSTLEKLPSHMGTKYKGMSVEEVLATNPEPGISQATIHKFISYIIGLWNHAIKNEWTDKNPAQHMRPPKSRRVQELRSTFTDDDLAKVFSAAYREETTKRKRPDRFWIPLVLLHTGARLEEIAQLEVADVLEVNGIPAIRISEESEEGTEEKSLKTSASRRTVPVHSWLIDAGFLQFVEQTKAAGEKRLFPQLSKGNTRYGDAISKWFTRWRRDVGITDPKKVLHSFRHTVITRLKDADVQDYTVSEIVGHEVTGMTMGRYGKPLRVAKLREAIEILDFSRPLEGLRD